MASDAEWPIVVGLGELLWDCFADGRKPGGAPANVAFQACQLGCEGIVCSRVGRDPLGDELVAFLASQGLKTDWVQRDREHPTGTVTVDASQPDHPRYVIHENVAWDHLECGDATAALAGRAAAVCFGTLAQRCEASRAAIRRILASVGPQCLVVYDVNLRQHFYDRQWIATSLDRADVVKLNADEAAVLDRLMDWNAPDMRSFARKVQQTHGVATVCVTRAERGCLLAVGDDWVESPGVRVELSAGADAVGAGDAFTAALIVGQLRRWPAAAQASFANAVGALVASRPGAMPPLRDAFAQLLKTRPP